MPQGRGSPAKARERHPKKGHSVLCQPRSAKYAWINTHQKQYPLEIMCKVLEVPKSSYTSWKSTNHQAKEKRLKTETQWVRDAYYVLKKRAGTRRIKSYLKQQHNIEMSRKKIGRIMKQNNLIAQPTKPYKKSNVAPANNPLIAPNLLKRNFTVSYPNHAWVADITEIKLKGGQKGYLAAYIDLYSRKVVGWAFDTHMRSELVETALKRALWTRKPPKG